MRRIFFLITIILSAAAFISGSFAVSLTHAETGTRDIINITTKALKTADQFIEVNMAIPVIEGLQDGKTQTAVNSSFKRDALEFKDTIEKQARSGYLDAQKGNYPFHTYQAYMDYKVAYNSDNILSIPVTYYSYTGGAHGMTNIVARNINLNTGKEIALKDIFKEGVDYKDIIKQEVAKQINQQPEIYFEDAVKTVEKSNEEPSFYIENGSIIVYFPLYSIAPYSSGIREFRIPLEKFRNGLDSEYVQIVIYNA